MRHLFTASCLCLFFWFGGVQLLHTEEVYLKNIRQVTFSDMGFIKSGEAYFSPDDASILFQAVPVGQLDYQIYYMDLDKSVPIRVSTGKGACTCAYFHPNGEKILFASSHSDPCPAPKEDNTGGYKWELTPYMNIYEANRDGSDLTPLTFGPAYHAECAYSADGKKIVYASNETGCMHVFVMEADGSHSVQLTHTEGVYNGGPFFSPDGSKIIFRADKERPHYLQIYMIDVQDQTELQLTDHDAVNWAPYWYPDGKSIAFTTSLHGHDRYEIYMLHLESGQLRRITDHRGFDGLPVFSHDGTKLLWTSKRSPDGACHIFIADFIYPF